PVWLGDRFLYSMAIGRNAAGNITLYAVDVDDGGLAVFAVVKSDGTPLAEQDVRRDYFRPATIPESGAAGPDGSLYAGVDSHTLCPDPDSQPRAIGLARFGPDLTLDWFRATRASWSSIHANDDGSIDLAGAVGTSTPFGTG